MVGKSDSLGYHKAIAYETARELCYPVETLCKICKAKSEMQIDRILHQARDDDKHEYMSNQEAEEKLLSRGIIRPRTTSCSPSWY